jgi:DNA polymerase-3 subunit gamma/tau
MRDSLSLLDQVIAFCGTRIDEAQVREVLGIADRGLLTSLTQAVLEGDGQRALLVVEELFHFGLDLQKFAAEFVQHLRDLMVVKLCRDPARLVDLPESEVEATIPVVRRIMVDAPHPAVQLAVPLQVDARAAHNWDEAH